MSNKKLQWYTCVWIGFFQHFSVEETTHFSKAIVVCICHLYLLLLRILITMFKVIVVLNSETFKCPSNLIPEIWHPVEIQI